MPAKAKTLGEYLRELEKAKKEKPEQVKEALEIYLELWQRAVKKGIVMQGDQVEAALSKIDASGGLYKAAED